MGVQAVTRVYMGDGIAFVVDVSYRRFGRRWARALVGGRWHGFWFRFHLRIGVRIRRRVRFLRVEPLGSGRVLWLNPCQICVIEEATA